MSNQTNLEELILEFCYLNFLENYKYRFQEGINTKIPISNLYTMMSLDEDSNSKKIHYLIENLERETYLIAERDAYKNIKYLSMTIEGIIYYENKYHKDNQEFINLITEILDIFKKIEEEIISFPNYEIPFSELLNTLHLKKVDENINRKKIHWIITFIQGIFIRKKICGYIGVPFFGQEDCFKFYCPNHPILTKSGKKFLNYQLNLRNLFQNVSDDYGRELVMEEYKDIYRLIDLKKWKDVAIKMGGILDYLTYDFFLQNNIIIPNKKNPNFGDRLLHIQQKILLGDPNDWFKADNILRKYRNFIHLQELVNRNYIFDKKTIDLIFPIFEKLILLF